METSNGAESESPRAARFAAYAWAVTALTLAVILWGAYVRASRSGDGCGAHWPLCNGSVMPDATHAKTLVEFAHRVTSGLAFLLVVGLVVWAFRAFGRGHAARAAAVASGVFIVTESLIGAGLVLLRLVADNASVARAGYLSVHLVNTFLLVAALALTAWCATAANASRVRLRELLRGRAGAALFAALVLGVSGAVAALGATLFPESAQSAPAPQETSPSAQLLFSLRQYKLHPLLAVLVGGYLAYFALGAYRSSGAGAWVRRWAASVLALVAAQLGAGLLNAALLAPVWLQIVHLLLADLLWLALVLLSASSLAQTKTSSEEFGRVGLRTAVEI
ncbi:MAG TPA: COX15/CtaA family protein [Pyrinomonadaceae bacterium]|nr:COX15/CtaA family protein [Pyrinomonadaceae bacterium]